MGLGGGIQVSLSGPVLGPEGQDTMAWELGRSLPSTGKQMAVRLYLAKELLSPTAWSDRDLEGEDGMEPRSGSHLTSMSFFSSASNSFSDKWARR